MVPQDENWRALIEYAHSNGGYTGRAPFPSVEAAEDNAVADRLERVFGEMNIAAAADDNQEEQGRCHKDFMNTNFKSTFTSNTSVESQGTKHFSVPFYDSFMGNIPGYPGNYRK